MTQLFKYDEVTNIFDCTEDTLDHVADLLANPVMEPEVDLSSLFETTSTSVPAYQTVPEFQSMPTPNLSGGQMMQTQWQQPNQAYQSNPQKPVAYLPVACSKGVAPRCDVTIATVKDEVATSVYEKGAARPSFGLGGEMAAGMYNTGALGPGVYSDTSGGMCSNSVPSPGVFGGMAPVLLGNGAPGPGVFGGMPPGLCGNGAPGPAVFGGMAPGLCCNGAPGPGIRIVYPTHLPMMTQLPHHGLKPPLYSTEMGRPFCWGAELMGDSSRCTPDFSMGKAHMKNKFCEVCKAGIDIPVSRVRVVPDSVKELVKNGPCEVRQGGGGPG